MTRVRGRIVGRNKATQAQREVALPTWTDICSSAIAPALLYYRPSMALCNSCIDLQGRRKCRKIVWNNRGHHIPMDYVGKGREHDCRSRAPTVGALGAASAPAHAKYLHPCRQRRSSCRGAEAFPANYVCVCRKRLFSLPLKPTYFCPAGIPAYALFAGVKDLIPLLTFYPLHQAFLFFHLPFGQLVLFSMERILCRLEHQTYRRTD
jgi:hypothetical protein